MTIAAVDTLIARACASTGLSEFGPGGWREGLGILVETMSAHDYGEVANGRIEARLTGVLASRLRIEDWIARHPEVLDEKIAGPVFVIGMPRTGTTALQAFLANDPQWRYLRGWEANAPVPPPELASEASDPRAVAERAALHDAGGLGQNVHIQEAGGPVDDAALLRLDFRNQELGWPAWPYTRWWRGCDMTTAYAYHARVLKLLQSRRPPNRWMVKAPWHNFHIDALARQYPDARFVMCHRDPAKLLPSVASVVRSVHRGLLGTDAASSQDIGAFVLEHMQVSIARVMAFRAEHGSERFYDMPHKAFNADPFATVSKIYDWLGVELSPQGRAAMEAWNGRNRAGAHGEHSYTAAEFGLEPERMREVFGAYIARFGL